MPVTFEDAPDNMNSSHGEGMPHHLYGEKLSRFFDEFYFIKLYEGLDSDGVGGGGRKSPGICILLLLQCFVLRLPFYVECISDTLKPGHPSS